MIFSICLLAGIFISVIVIDLILPPACRARQNKDKKSKIIFVHGKIVFSIKILQFEDNKKRYDIIDINTSDKYLMFFIYQGIDSQFPKKKKSTS